MEEATASTDVVVNGPFASFAEAKEKGAVMTSKPVTFQVFRSVTSFRTDISADNTLQITGINTTPHPFAADGIALHTRVDECIAAADAVRGDDRYINNTWSDAEKAARVAAVWTDDNGVHISGWN